MSFAQGVVASLTQMQAANDKRFGVATVGATLTLQQLLTLWRKNGYVQQLVARLPLDCTRRGFTIEDEETDEILLESETQQLDIAGQLRLAHQWGDLLGGGAAVMGVNDGQDPSKPIDLKRVKGISFITVMDATEIYATQYVTTATASLNQDKALVRRNPGDVEIYRVQSADPGAMAIDVHADRVLAFDGVRLPRQLQRANNGWGDSIIQASFDSLSRLIQAEASLAQILEEWRLAVMQIKGYRELVAQNGGREKLVERLAAFNLAKRISGLATIDMDLEKIDFLTTSVAGVSDTYDRLAQSYAAQVGRPITLVFGQAPAGLSTDDASGNRFWNNFTAATWAIKYRPLIERVARLLLAAKGEADRKITIEMVPLEAPTEKQDAETDKLQGEAAQLWVALGADPKPIVEAEGYQFKEKPVPPPIPVQPPAGGAGTSRSPFARALPPPLPPQARGGNGVVPQQSEAA